jgi:DNA-binding response OmpR family regulator
MISGGNDYIAKPFLFMELAVKAIVFLLRSRLEAPKETQPA